MKDLIQARIQSSVDLKSSLLKRNDLLQTVERIVELVVQCYRNGGKVLWCGNGGSAADAQHLAAELSGRFYYDRDPLPSEALHTNTSYLTAVANDYSYEVIYSRLVKAMCKKGDVLVGMSTSGNSLNVIRALEKARTMSVTTVGFTGQGGGKMAPLCDHLLDIPSTDTPRIQECHMLLGHTICELVEAKMFPRS